MSLALSAVLLLIIVLFAVIGAKKGFFATIAGLVCPLGSLVLTLLFYKPVAALLKSTLFASMVSDVPMPDFSGASDVISKLTVMMEYLNNNDLGEVSKAITDNVMAEVLSIAVAIIGLFIVLLIALKIVFKVLDIISNLPVLTQANGLLGGIIGAVEGFIWCWVFALVFGSFIFPSLNASNPELFTVDMLTSPVYQFCTKFNPVGLIASLIQLITGA
jgi:uncharacterized membrane protein required for colicin V production